MNNTLPSYLEITDNVENVIIDILNKNSYSQLFILVDENTEKHCYPLIKNNLVKAHRIKIKSGESNKTLATCSIIWQALTDLGADRKAILINLGGGVIGDMGGFCASTYKRGIDFINIPTTLLSQVDASIGGKLGVDFGGYKNHIGLFNLPKKVIIDTAFLATLPQNQIKSGFAEMLKHACINNIEQLDQMAKIDIHNFDWKSLIESSIAIKNAIVESDPFEKGNRKFLNFGHTIGHAVETYFLNNNIPILHGEAVALGMITEGYLSSKLLGLPIPQRDKLIKIIDTYFNRINIPLNGMEEILNNVEQDKKNEGSSIQAVLLSQLGKAKHSITISKIEIEESLNFYNTK